MFNNKKILVLDSNQRSSLAVIRSLGKIPEVEVYSSDSVSESIGGSSKYSNKYLISPSLKDSPVAYLNWLEQIIKTYQFDFVFPITEPSSQLILMNQKVLGTAIIPFASYDTVTSIADKGKLMHLARKTGVTSPYSVLYHNVTEVDQNQKNQFPLVIKPCLSHIWQGDSWLSTTVQIAQNQQQLTEFLNSTPWLQNNAFMLQQFIPGYGVGLFALYNHGEPVAFFAHQRLREKPPRGGVSVLCKSAQLSQQLLENTKILLGSAKWHGVAMVEFRVAEDGTPYLMEVNTRFWGSLQLAIDAGVNFPELLYRISLGEEVPLVNNYKIGVRMRWLLGDIDSLYLTLRDQSYSKMAKFNSILNFLTPHAFSTYHQVNRWNDLKPAYTELKQYIKNLIR